MIFHPTVPAETTSVEPLAVINVPFEPVLTNVYADELDAIPIYPCRVVFEVAESMNIPFTNVTVVVVLAPVVPLKDVNPPEEL